MKFQPIDENGNVDFMQLIGGLIALGLISYITNFALDLFMKKESIADVVNRTNSRCPIVLIEGLTLDSVAYDGKQLYTQYVSWQIPDSIYISKEKMDDSFEYVIEQRFNEESLIREYLISHGLIVHFVFYSPNGEPIYDVKVDKDMVR